MNKIRHYEKETWHVRISYAGETDNGYGFESFDHKPSPAEILTSIETQKKTHPSYPKHPLVWGLVKETKKIVTEEEVVEDWQEV